MLFKTLLLCAVIPFASGYAQNEPMLLEANTGTEIVEPDESTTDTETSVETPVWEQKTYTFTEDEKTTTITLVSAKEYTLKIDGSEETAKGNYELKDNILSLYYEGVSFVKLGDFTINEDNTLTKYEPELNIPTNKEEAVDTLKTWLGQWLSPQMVTIIITILALLIIATIFIAKDFKNRRIHSTSNEEVKEAVLEKVSDVVEEKINEITPEILASLNTQTDTLKTFAKIMCLAQEHTPNSRVAILELIEKLGLIEKENIEASKKIVESKEAQKMEHKEKVVAELDKIIEDTEDGTTI